MSGRPTDRAPEALYASLQNPGETREADTFATRKRTGLYVIVGRGPAAWFNHLTLLHGSNAWGARRLAGLDVVHVGFREYWESRKKERMGQWPRMLDLFRNLGEGLGLEAGAFTRPEDWLPADEFAKSLQAAEEYLTRAYAEREATLTFRDGFVGLVESLPKSRRYDRRTGTWPRPSASAYRASLPKPELARRERARLPNGNFGDRWTNADCPYRLSVFLKGALDFLYAQKVDICTGFGMARLLNRRVFSDQKLYDEQVPRLDRQPTNATPQRIMDGNVYIGSANTPTDNVVVYKGNPVGAQSVQSALDMPECRSGSQRVWWMSNKDLFSEPLDANVPGARNLLEIVGASTYEDLGEAVKRELDENFGTSTSHYLHYRLYANGERRARLGGRLLRGAHHALQRISPNEDGTVQVHFTTVQDDGIYEQKRLSQDSAIRAVQQMRTELGDNPWPAEATTEDVAEAQPVVASVKANRFVYALGQQNDTGAEGSAAYLIQNLGAFRILRDRSRSQFVLGLTDDQEDGDVGGCGCVRVLGAAAAKGAGLSSGEARTHSGSHADHGNTLPQECPAGGGGLNVNVPGIWRANQFTPNPVRLNTASPEELEAAGLSPQGARFIVAARSATVRGMSVVEMQTTMREWRHPPTGAPTFPPEDITALDTGFTF